jgi:hypothetical protein
LPRSQGCEVLEATGLLAVMATKAAGDPIDVSFFSDQIRRDFRNSPGGR